MRRARLWRYVGWQTRDFVAERGAPLIIVASLMVFPLIMGLRALRNAGATSIQAQDSVNGALMDVLANFSLIAVLIGINGVVSNDRVRGYFRFLFAKPVSIPRYYAQAYVMNGVGLLVATLGVLGAIYAFGSPIFLPRVLLMVGLMYVALGGLGFLYSTLARFDWVMMGATMALAHLLRFYPSPQSRAGRVLDVILPPFHELRTVGIQLARGEATEPRMLLWLLGWGIIAFVLGLLVLRRRPLAT
jgi:hypothetical protein